jgi:hypothetical protein
MVMTKFKLAVFLKSAIHFPCRMFTFTISVKLNKLMNAYMNSDIDLVDLNINFTVFFVPALFMIS